MRNLRIGMIFAFSLIAAFCVIYEAKSQATKYTEGIVGTTQELRSIAYQNLLIQRKETISELLCIIRGSKGDTVMGSSYYYAIKLLGEYRAVEAVDSLSNLLLYIPRLNSYNDASLPKEAYHPAAVSLVLIGDHSLEAMIGIIDRSGNIEECNMAAWVILTIRGKESGIQYLDSNKGLIRSIDKLERAKEYINKYKPVPYAPGRK